MEIFNRQAIQQGLSLSLSSEQPGYRPPPPVAVISPRGGEGSSSVSGVSNGNFGMQSLILGSKYLKVAQQILDEVVSVGDHVVKAEEMKEMLKVDNNNNNNNSNTTIFLISVNFSHYYSSTQPYFFQPQQILYSSVSSMLTSN